MSRLSYKVMIEDIQNEGCTDAEVDALTDIFVYTTKRIAATLARKAWFDLNDYASARQLDIGDFSLTIERKTIHMQEQWWGTFQHDSKELNMIATLEC